MLSVDKQCSGLSENVKQHKRKALESFLKKVKKRKLEKIGVTKKNDVELPCEASEEGTLFETAEEGTPFEAAEDGTLFEAAEEKKESFTKIGKHPAVKNGKVEYHLPDWLAHPEIIPSDLKTDKCAIEELKGLNERLLEKLRLHDIHSFFPVQKAVIPFLLRHSKKGLANPFALKPQDVCVSAPTGSGKTLTYVLPIIQWLSNRLVPKIRALVMVPVQELAIQVCSVFREYCKGTTLKVDCATGKTPLNIEQAKLIRKFSYSDFDGLFDEYESAIDILVTTPGRLVDHLENTKGFDLSFLRFLVIDEADRMVSNIQNDWLHHLDKHMKEAGCTTNFSNLTLNDLKNNRSPQKLLFSATLSQDPEMLNKLNLFQPLLFSTISNSKGNFDKTDDYIGSFTTPSELKEKYIIVDPSLKPLVICELLAVKLQNVLCFTKSAIEAHKLSKLLSILNPGIRITEISSLLSADLRGNILNEFSSGLINVLVSSDVMARGVDINGVKCVISYDPPKHIKSYIHRIGRTGRAGMKGKAITILSPSQAPAFNRMLLDVNKNDVKQMAVDENHLNKMMPRYKAALQELKLVLKKEESDRCQKLKKEKMFSHKRKKSGKNKAKKTKHV